MKLLLFHSNPKLLCRLLERPLAGQNVVISCSNRGELIPLIAATEPHLVVIGAEDPEVPPKEIEGTLRDVGFHTRILILPNECLNDQHLDAVWLSLRSFPREPLCAEFDPQHYTVLTEEKFEPMGAGACAPPDDSARQENRLLTLLATGVLQHARAQAYLSATIATQRSYQREWTLGALFGDAMAYLWRSQLFRYASTLAHYIPGMSTECLPLPHPPAQRLDYLHTALPPEALYTLCALRAFGVNPGFAQGLWSVGQLQVTQDPRLSGEAAQLAGWAGLLREVATAHVRVLDACLADPPAQLAAFQDTRHLRNLQRIFCQWWQLTNFTNSTGDLQKLVREFKAGRRAVGISSFCSFYEFAEQIQRGEQATSLMRN